MSLGEGVPRYQVQRERRRLEEPLLAGRELEQDVRRQSVLEAAR